MARMHANLVEWMDDKGYGFARLPGGTERVFVHVKSFAKDAPRPQKGDELELEVIAGRNGKPAARNVRVLSHEEVSKRLPYHLVTAAMLFILANVVVITGHAPYGILFIYALMGGVSLFLYGRDKQAALFGWWRISENTLLIVDLFGGIVGGLLAQHRYRHKKSKQSYQFKTLLIVLLHASLLAAIGSGALTLDSIVTLLRFFTL